MSFFEHLKKQASAEWRAYTEHPFTEGLADGSLPDKKYFTVGSKIYTDAQIRYKGIKNFEIFAGVNNLFNVKQPPLWVGTPNGSPNAIWDIIGRRYYGGVRAKF